MFLREKEKEALVKTMGRPLAARNGIENMKENRGGKRGNSPPCRKRDTIRPRGRVICVVYSNEYVVKRDRGAK